MKDPVTTSPPIVPLRSPDCGPSGNEFNGEIEWVRIDLGDDNHSHLITPEGRFNPAMARQ